MNGILQPPRRPVPAIDAVLFDMDGLLVDSEPVWVGAIDAFCRRRGGQYAADDAVACMGRGIPFTARYLSDKYGWSLVVEATVEEICADFGRAVPRAPECEGAGALLRALQGRKPAALGSSTARPLVEAALGERGWLSLFATLVTGSDVARLKPAPDIYLEVARRLGVQPARCVVFEDSPVGCQAAQAAGMFVVAVPGPHGPAPQADMVVASLTVAARALGLLGAEGEGSSPGPLAR